MTAKPKSKLPMAQAPAVQLPADRPAKTTKETASTNDPKPKPTKPKFETNFEQLLTLARLDFDSILDETGVQLSPAETGDLTLYELGDSDAAIAANRSAVRGAVLAIVRECTKVEGRKIHAIMNSVAGKAFVGRYDKGYVAAPTSASRGMVARGMLKVAE